MWNWSPEEKQTKNGVLRGHGNGVCWVGEVGFLLDASTGKSLSLEGFRNMEEKVQDAVGGLQDLTEKERDVLSCLTKCLTSDGELQALEERVRGPRKNWGRGREEPEGRAADTPTVCASGTGAHLPFSGPQVSEVLISEVLQVEGPADPLIGSLFNAAGILVEARIEAILDFLDALKGEEGSGWMLVWRKCRAEEPVGHHILGGRWYTLPLPFVRNKPSHFRN